MTDHLEAPWTEQQVAALNAFQRSGNGLVFTCDQHPMKQTLIAELDGWHCPDEQCGHHETWAFPWMADRQLAAMVYALDPPPRPPQPSLAAELRRVREQLRATEDQLAEQRRLNDQLRVDSDRKLAYEQGRVKALIAQVRMLDRLRKPVLVPAPSEPPCGEILRSATIQHAGSIDTWEDR